MLKTAKKSTFIVGALMLFVVGITAVSSVFALPSLQTAFIAKYTDTRETRLDGCATCHMPVTEDFLNGYGLALREAKMDFTKIEELDSDEDGRTNIDEIKDERFPGSQAIFSEYFIYHVDFSDEDPELGKIHFNHEMHTIKESYLSKGRCKNCHGKDLFAKKFDDSESIRVVAHQICWSCHETSGSNMSPTDCTGCHTGIKDIMEDLKELLK